MQANNPQHPSSTGGAYKGSPQFNAKIILIVVMVVILCLAGLAIYIVRSSSDDDRAGDSAEEDSSQNGKQSQIALSEENRNTVLTAADNMLQTKAIDYDYAYNGLTQVFADSSSVEEDRVESQLTYSFRADNLDNLEKRIVHETFRISISQSSGMSPPYLLELETIKHKENLYVKLVDMEVNQLLAPGVTQAAIDSLKGKWLKFTFGYDYWPELESRDFERLRNTDIGSLLRFLEKQTVGLPAAENTFLLPAHFISLFSYERSVFGHLDEAEARRRIINEFIGFSDDIERQPAFIVSDCSEIDDQKLECSFVSNKQFWGDLDLLHSTHREIVSLAGLAGIISTPPKDDIGKFLTDIDDITSQEGSIIIDTEKHLPISSKSLTGSSWQAETEEGLFTVESRNGDRISHNSWNQDLGLTLPADITSLSDL